VLILPEQTTFTETITVLYFLEVIAPQD
jgi:hypothetical protein